MRRRVDTTTRRRTARLLVCFVTTLVAVVSAELPTNPSSSSSSLVLSEKMLQLSKTAAQLSLLAYNTDTTDGVQQQQKGSGAGRGDYDPELYGFKAVKVFRQEPDQAMFAKKNGYCFAAFRGTTFTWDDWKENLESGTRNVVCRPTASPAGGGSDVTTTTTTRAVAKGEQCCTTRLGFWEAYNTTYRDELEKALKECAKDCVNADDCVVLTGHSQGGAVAGIAALVLAELNPYVITFGQPLTLARPCYLATSDRWYRYVNTKAHDDPSIFQNFLSPPQQQLQTSNNDKDIDNDVANTDGDDNTDADDGDNKNNNNKNINLRGINPRGTVWGISYDPIPFVRADGMEHFGHYILLTNDPTGVAYMGLDAQTKMSPVDMTGLSHSMGTLFVTSPSSTTTTTMTENNGTASSSQLNNGTESSSSTQNSGDIPSDLLSSFFNSYGLDVPSSTTFDPTFGYVNRLTSILQHYEVNASFNFPVQTSGYSAGRFCSKNRECHTLRCQRETPFSYRRCVGTTCAMNEQCTTNTTTTSSSSSSSGGRCESGQCVPKLGSCMSCDDDSDCLSNKCGWNFRCAAVVVATTTTSATATNSSSSSLLSSSSTSSTTTTSVVVGGGAKMDNQCFCVTNDDCVSGRCEGVLPRVCQPKLGLGAHCSEASDCLSGQCSWHFRCGTLGDDTASAAANKLGRITSSNNGGVDNSNNDISHEQPSKKSVSGGFFLKLIGMALLLGLAYLYQQYYSTPRRRGYEEIPVRLVV